MKDKLPLPILIPYETAAFWEQVRLVIREEINDAIKEFKDYPINAIPGLPIKPLYKVDEICRVLRISKPTIYDWIKQGKISPYRIGTRTYFLYEDVQKLVQPSRTVTGYRHL